jgi:hypothetical protein
MHEWVNQRGRDYYDYYRGKCRLYGTEINRRDMARLQ